MSPPTTGAVYKDALSAVMQGLKTRSLLKTVRWERTLLSLEKVGQQWRDVRGRFLTLSLPLADLRGETLVMGGGMLF